MSLRYRLYKLKLRAKAIVALAYRRSRRVFISAALNADTAFDVPIVINNRNRVSYLRDLVDWLTEAGYRNVIILDNDSTYGPLLRYYEETPARVVKLGYNGGYKALWESDLFDTIKHGYYVYTDADLIPGANCPADLVYRLYKILDRYPVEKCGPALRIHDLPDHYLQKQQVLDNETRFWQQPLETGVYLAPVDTTFALYKPLAWGNAEECRAVRAGGNLEFIHRPWYEDSAHPDEETQYYIRHASQSSVWYRAMKNTTA